MTDDHDAEPFLCSADADTTAGLAGCGSSTIESALKPERFISFGDAFSDLGQAGARYTVNTTTTVAPIWAETLAAGFGKTLTTSLTASGVFTL